MRQDIQTKREELKALSKAAGILIKAGAYSSINEALVGIYATNGHTEIHSFKKWLQLGYCVKRGEKALLLWGEPRKAANQEKQEGSNDKDEFSFFPLAYVFSQLQVQPLNQPKEQKQWNKYIAQ